MGGLGAMSELQNRVAEERPGFAGA